MVGREAPWSGRAEIRPGSKSRSTTVPEIGVLALQGGVAEHARILEGLGAPVRPVRKPEDLEGIAGIVLPGGESTTIDRLLRLFGLAEPLGTAIAEGLPTLGTCAGLILLAREIVDPAAGQQTLGVLDVTVRRGAFGPQVDSAEATLPFSLTGRGSVEAAFIRAPEVVRVGPGVQVVSTFADAAGAERIVGVATDTILGLSYHPELTGDTAAHGVFLDRCTQSA